MSIGPDHYRYSDVLNEYGQTLVEEVYRVIRETPAGYWVMRMHGYRFSDEVAQEAYLRRKRDRNIHFVLKRSVRRYCYPTKLEAMKSFAIRKGAQIKHARLSLARATHAMDAAHRIIGIGLDYPVDEYGGGRGIKVGMPPEYVGSSWE